MISAPGTIGVEVFLVDAVLDQIFAGGAVGLDRTGRRNVVRGDAVAEFEQNAGALDVGDGGRLHAHALEIGWVFDVGGFWIPLVKIPLGNRQLGPALIA